ncbi:hypothetical protein MLD38_020325 [Melastoma candidum]|uniref:Uncharacterized protein n=1 Tax=Melastoma candidum TaxID=119954 RepID=A0ACB9QC50_9MYRT|nr:hypothetical protein MLD38_020325 [Melastoma candidum]
MSKGDVKRVEEDANPVAELSHAGTIDPLKLSDAGDEKMENNEMRDVQNTLGDMSKDEDDCTTSHDVRETENAYVKTKKKNKRKRQLMKEVDQADKRGICYLSRIPPRMDHVKLRHILSQYGEIQRIYLAPEDPATHTKRKKAGGFRGEAFSEGWVEFAKRSVAKRVADMLNGEQIGGKKRSAFYYDIWNIKYLKKFRWDDLTEEIAYKKAVREQKLALELSAAKRERDFYLSRVDKSRALASIEERLKKKQKLDELADDRQSKVIRQFPQKRPIPEATSQEKPRLSKEILAGVFGGC